MNSISSEYYGPIKAYKLGSNLLGKPRIYVYSFLVDNVLIDTGQTLIQKELNDALQDESLQKIIVTHHHEDHSGNIESIKKSKKVEAYASPLCCELLRNPPKLEPARLIFWGQNKPAYPLPLSLTEHIQTEHYNFEIIETPGHSIDHISLLEKNEGWLFSGDVYVHDFVNIFMRNENIANQIRSIQKLLKFEFDILLCCHQPIRNNGKQRLEKKLNFLIEFFETVKSEHLKGKRPSEIMKSTPYKESYVTKFLSMGQISRKNMIKSVIDNLSFQP